jgi:hypothetical protein
MELVQDTMNFIIGSGYHYKSEWDRSFYDIWRKNTENYTRDYHIISTVRGAPATNHILCDHNLGHVGDLIREGRGGLCGWSASVCALAMVAYNTGKDFCFKEADCLFFGDVVGQMYRDCGDKGMVFGAKMDAAPWMACAQSAFLIRHWFILDFLRAYLFLPDDKDMLPEDKFVKLEENHPDRLGRLSFGVDRMRPLPWDAPVWYAQQWSQGELDEAKGRGII